MDDALRGFWLQVAEPAGSEGDIGSPGAGMPEVCESRSGEDESCDVKSLSPVKGLACLLDLACFD
jgi:hypothetical protein